MIPKTVLIITAIIGVISLCVLIGCLAKGMYDRIEDYDDCEV